MKKFRFALIGHNVTYSKSTDIFNAIFDIEGIQGSCEIINIDPAHFQAEFSKLSSKLVDGVSVTIPFKKAVITHLDEIDPIADAIEAVNSIHFSNGKKIGYNTDCYGFSNVIQKQANLLKNDSALIFGAGGAAKAVVYALYTDYEMKDFTIIARNKEKVIKFHDSLKKQISSINIKTYMISALPDSFYRDRFAIAVNCTPLGGWNYPDLSPFPMSLNWKNIKIYYDLNYNSGNKLIEKANRNELVETFDGSAMLVDQAIRSFFLWTGIKTDFNKVYSKVFG